MYASVKKSREDKWVEIRKKYRFLKTDRIDENMHWTDILNLWGLIKSTDACRMSLVIKDEI